MDGENSAIIPMLVPTFSAISQKLEREAVPLIEDGLKVFTEIQMHKTVSEGIFQESAKEHVDKVVHAAGQGRVLSALHVHLSMKQDDAADILDYLRFQIEWVAREIQKRLETGKLCPGVHVLALVVHGVRGSSDLCMRPFLLAGPVDAQMRGAKAEVHPWRGASVDHFSHLLPWGMQSEVLAYGSIIDIFGLEEADIDRFPFRTRRCTATCRSWTMPGNANG